MFDGQYAFGIGCSSAPRSEIDRAGLFGRDAETVPAKAVEAGHETRARVDLCGPESTRSHSKCLDGADAFNAAVCEAVVSSEFGKGHFRRDERERLSDPGGESGG